MSGSVRSSALFSVFLSIVFGYYYGFKIILKTRAGVISYLAYLGLAWFIGSLTVIQWMELMHHTDFLMNVSFGGLFWLLIMPLMVAFVPPLWVYQWQKFKESPTYRRLFSHGGGGSAAWASVGTISRLSGKLNLKALTYWWNKRGATSEGLFVGRSFLSDDPFQRPVVIKESDHHVCIGKSGSGKFVCILSHFLSLCNQMTSVICLDVKGELSKATANRRHHQNLGGKTRTKKHFKNGRVKVLDAFNHLEEDNFDSTKYNVLSEIDPTSPYARSLLAAISDGCFPPEDVEQMHFKEVPKIIFEGFMAHVLTTYPKECHNLPFVYDLIRCINPQTGLVDLKHYQKVIKEMSQNDAIGGLPQEAARVLIEMGANERGSMQSTLSRHLKWIGDPKMREHLQDSDFTFWNYGVKKAKIDGKDMNLCETVYIVIPDQLIKEQMRYVRMIFNLAIRIMQYRTEKPKQETLVIIDEFPRLGGNIDAVTEGFSILRSYKVKLIVFLQDLTQLKRDYPKRWSSILANSTLQIFGVKDLETAEYVSQMLGSRVLRRYERQKGAMGFSKKVIANEATRELLTPSEVMDLLGSASPVQIIFPNQGLPMRLERLAFKPMRLGGSKFKALGLGGLKKQIEDEMV